MTLLVKRLKIIELNLQVLSQDIYIPSPPYHRQLVHKERTWAQRPSKGADLAPKGLRINILVWVADVGKDTRSVLD